jgi:hypothetical protein
MFIVIFGLAAGILIPLTQGVSGSANPVLTQQAIALAQGELDQTVAQRHAFGFGPVATGACVLSMAGFPGFSCSRTVCFVPATNLNDTSNCGVATNFKQVQVTITKPEIGDTTAVTLVTNY